MKLAMSNIAWPADEDKIVYRWLQDGGFSGLEIAPTRIFPERPYQRLAAAREFAEKLKAMYGLEVCSIQSIWYGKRENIFDGEEARRILMEYTKQAIDFARAMGCKSLVFGCPRNRVIPHRKQYPIAVDFFKTAGDYAASREAVLAIEANPKAYHTNFITTTAEAFQFCADVASRGIAVNLDCGTMLANGEGLAAVADHISLIHHVHLSEVDLLPIKRRPFHDELARLLRQAAYQNYVSVEMRPAGGLEEVKRALDYVREIMA